MKTRAFTGLLATFLILFCLLTGAASAQNGSDQPASSDVYPLEYSMASEVQSDSITPSFSGDILVADLPDVDDVLPDIVSSSSGIFYLAKERFINGASSDCIDILSSSDGGTTWQLFFPICESDTISDPAITVPEYSEDFLYVTYRFQASSFPDPQIHLRFARIDLSDPTHPTATYQTIASSDAIYPPRIVTDNHDYSNYYIYVAYPQWECTLFWCYYRVVVNMSGDKGATWNWYQVTDDAHYSIDIAYGNAKLYVVWEDISTNPNSVHVSRSNDFGMTWETPVQLSNNDCDEPRVAATQDGNSVVVTFSYNNDTDVGYAYSLNQGSSWNSYYCLSCGIYDYSKRPDITVDPTLGYFHIVYWREGNIEYRKAPHTSLLPSAWSLPTIVNDTFVPDAYIQPTVAVDWTTGASGVSWSSVNNQTLTSAIYFDRADWPLYTLTITKSGAGSGTVTSSPAGINCGKDCSELYSGGTVVTLTASPNADSYFDSWSGSSTDCQDGIVTMDVAKTCTAVFFKKLILSVTKTGTGTGTVTSSPAGINCGIDCSELYSGGTIVTLTATSGTGSVFGGWSGNNKDCEDGVVTMNMDMTCTATFNIVQHTLTVTKAGTGNGTVTSNPVGIDCGNDCTEPYNHGSVVTLTAASAIGSIFAGWSGNVDCSDGTVTIDADKTCTATFNSNLSVKLVPDSTSVPQGGILGYNVTVTNNTSTTQTFKYWTYIFRPNGSRYPAAGELFGPVNVTLNPGQSRSTHLTQIIPMSAPLGTYTYFGNVGPYPTVWDNDAFSFTVTATTNSPGGAADGWQLMEEGLTE